MEALGSIAPRFANGTDQTVSSKQMSQTRLAETHSARRTITGGEPDASSSPPKEIPGERMERIAGALLNFVRSVQTDLSIEVHRGTGKIMVQVISKTDGKVIREIPPEELLDLAAKMEEVVGAIFNKNA